MAESNVVRELLVRLGVITDDASAAKAFDAQIDAAKKSMQTAGEYAGKAKEQVTLLVGQFVAAGAAAATAVGGLVYLSDETATYALNVERQAMALGMTTDVYQELRSTFERFGVDQRDVADLFAQISQQATAAQGGAKGIEQAFNTLGIASKDLKGKDPEGILLAIADGAARTKDPVQRLSALSSLLGEDLTKKLAPLLQQGSAGIAEFRKEIRELGGVMDGEAIESAGAYKDAVGDLKIVITGIGREIGAYFLPTLAKLAKKMQGWIQETRKSPARIRAIGAALLFAASGASALFIALAAFRAGSAAFNGIMAITNVLGGGLAVVVPLLYSAGGAAATLGGVLGGLTALPLTILVAAALAWIAMLAAAFAGIAAGLTTAYLILEDVMMFLSGTGDTVLGRFVDNLSASDTALGAMARTFDDMRRIVGSWLSILGSLATMLGVTLAPAIDAAHTALGLLYTFLAAEFTAGVENAFRPFYLFEKLLDTLVPMINRLAFAFDAAARSGMGIGGLAASLFPDAGAAAGSLGSAPGMLASQMGSAASLFSPFMPQGGGSRSYTDQSSTTVQINGAQSPAATAGAVLPVVQEQRAKTNRATRATLGGGEL